VSTFRAEPTWWDDGRNPDGSPATRKVWTIEGPEPFGGLSAKDEDQAREIVQRLNASNVSTVGDFEPRNAHGWRAAFPNAKRPSVSHGCAEIPDVEALRQAVVTAEAGLRAASQHRDAHDWVSEPEEADRRWRLACEASTKLDAAKRALAEAEVNS
jgi:hypothetical protein